MKLEKQEISLIQLINFLTTNSRAPIFGGRDGVEEQMAGARENGGESSSAQLTVYGIIAAVGFLLALISIPDLPAFGNPGWLDGGVKRSLPDNFLLPPAEDGIEAAPTAPATASRSVTIRRGDTLMKAILRSGSDRKQAHAAITSLKDVFNPKSLRPGQTLTATFQEIASSQKGATGKAPKQLVALRLNTDAEHEFAAERTTDGDFTSHGIVKELERVAYHAGATINDSLFLAANRADVPNRLIMDVIRIFSWDVDFQRDIQRGDRFEILYERLHDESGKPVKDGAVLYAALTLSGVHYPLYRFESEPNRFEYFNNKGQSARKALLRTPVDGARLSSRYGKRRHPILGYTRMHRGLDFAAPRGTPIMAGGDGVIESIGRNGAYGRYIRLRHNSRYKTAYAHMRRYAKGMRRGKRVRQGQTIGYVGSSGRSTGPHLHYEVLVGNRQLNPLKIKLPTGQKLKGAELARFETLRQQVDVARAETPLATKLAQRR
jgi:murein DD-endopeptidase MepM/ murein hydrolase activator NlpD